MNLIPKFSYMTHILFQWLLAAISISLLGLQLMDIDFIHVIALPAHSIIITLSTINFFIGKKAKKNV